MIRTSDITQSSAPESAPSSTSTATEQTDPAASTPKRLSHWQRARYGKHSRHEKRVHSARRGLLGITVGNRTALVSLAIVIAGLSSTAAFTSIQKLDDQSVEAQLASDIIASAPTRGTSTAAIVASYSKDSSAAEAQTESEEAPADDGAGDEESSEAATEAAETSAINMDAAPVSNLDATQMTNALTVVKVGEDMGLDEQAWAVALATAMQESKFYNLANTSVSESYDYSYDDVAQDHDSVGVFQQRVSMDWGSVAELMNVETSATLFYEALIDTSSWESMSVAGAAQAVQVSAFPDAYAQWESLAYEIIAAATA